MITCCLAPEALAGGEVTIEGDAYRHLFRARRLAVGDRLRAVDGRGGARWAEVAAVDRRHARLELGGEAPSNEAAYRLELLVAAPRPERAAWLVEKATELGVSALRFLGGERAPRRYGRGQLERLERVARAALEQCHRARLPAVSGVHPWEELPQLLAAADDRWWLDPAAGPAALRPASAAGAVVVGPEGGWTEAERAQLSELGCRGVGLGPRVLRIETAALAAAARLMAG